MKLNLCRLASYVVLSPVILLAITVCNTAHAGFWKQYDNWTPVSAYVPDENSTTLQVTKQTIPYRVIVRQGPIQECAAGPGKGNCNMGALTAESKTIGYSVGLKIDPSGALSALGGAKAELNASWSQSWTYTEGYTASQAFSTGFRGRILYVQQYQTRTGIVNNAHALQKRCSPIFGGRYGVTGKNCYYDWQWGPVANFHGAFKVGEPYWTLRTWRIGRPEPQN